MNQDELLALIDQIAWGDNVTPRQRCPLCGAASVEGHVGDAVYFVGDNVCLLGLLRRKVLDLQGVLS